MPVLVGCLFALAALIALPGCSELPAGIIPSRAEAIRTAAAALPGADGLPAELTQPLPAPPPIARRVPPATYLTAMLDEPLEVAVPRAVTIEQVEEAFEPLPGFDHEQLIETVADEVTRRLEDRDANRHGDIERDIEEEVDRRVEQRLAYRRAEELEQHVRELERENERLRDRLATREEMIELLRGLAVRPSAPAARPDSAPTATVTRRHLRGLTVAAEADSLTR